MHLPPLAYSIWQKLFVAPKLAPLLGHSAYEKARTICELGCGPGSNYPFLSSRDYLGIDIGEDYIRHARQRHGEHFRVGDVSAGIEGIEDRFDLVLVHSVLHHLDDDQVVRTLTNARRLLAPGGSLHVFDVVLPPWWTLAGVLARLDEGKHVRLWESWEPLFARSMGSYERSDFPLRLAGFEAYRMFHLVTRADGG
jgi:SAM-dependent methyltransferase